MRKLVIALSISFLLSATIHGVTLQDPLNAKEAIRCSAPLVKDK